jgi:hypothetical protein
MNKYIKCALLTLVSVCLIIVTVAESQPPMQPITPQVPVHGIVIDSRTQIPIPGLTVSLIHPILGRSSPAFTDIGGRFTFLAIPVRPELYFIEIYWGYNLVYRSQIMVSSPLTLGPIFL